VSKLKRLFTHLVGQGSRSVMIKNSANIFTTIFSQGLLCRSIRKNCNIQPISHFILETVQDRAIVTMEGE